ncbi:MAG: serine hydrolase [Actinomycetota bacterium]
MRKPRGGAGRAAIMLAALGLVAAACTDEGLDETTDTSVAAPSDAEPEADPGDDEEADQADQTDEAAPPDGPPETVDGLPDNAVGRRIDAILGAAIDGTITEADAAEALDETFEAQVSPAEFVAVSGQIAGLLGRGPVVSSVQVDTATTFVGNLLNPTNGNEYVLSAQVGVTAPHEFRQLLIVPLPPEATPADVADLEAADAAWRALAPGADLVVTSEIGPSTGADVCPSGGEALAIGSAFKFYVLGAVATAVDEGTVAWTDEIVLDEARYSFPSGQLQLEEPGTTVTVAQAAELMIGISDNTATDHLIALVGRDAVEAEQARLGHEQPERNLPFFTTRELFLLKLGDPIRLGLVADGDEAERRAVLDDLADEDLPEIDGSEFTEPTAIDVEWLATVGDLCRAVNLLDERAVDHPEIAAALRSGRGLDLNPRTWPVVSFKGGSEPGVLSGTWLAEHESGRRFTISGILNDPESPVDNGAALALVARIFDILEEQLS